MPRPFYIIGHNTNNLNDVLACLRSGANAIEPDLYFKDQEYYMNEVVPIISKIFPPKKGPKLKDFFTDLKNALIADPSLNLAMILIDTKNIDQYNINDLFALVRQYFSNFFPQVYIGVTAGDKKYLPSFDDFIAETDHEIIGIDGLCTADEAHQYFNTRGIKYSYASGTGVPILDTTADRYKHQIIRAIQRRDHPANLWLKWVYVYTVNNANSIREYLRLNVDAINSDHVARVKSILAEDEFKDMYELVKVEGPTTNPILPIDV